VALADVNAAALDRAVAELGPKAVPVQMDVTSQSSIDAGFASAIQAMGQLDILINNAALFSAAPIVEITRADYDKLFAVNVAGTLFCTQAAARHMVPRGTGTIINMASQAGRRGEGLVAVYCATKAAVISPDPVGGAGPHQARHQRQRHRPRRGGWRALGRGGCLLRQVRRQGPRPEKARSGRAVPFGRMGTAADLTGMAIFLATPEAKYIVAQCFGVDGGNWMA
jgi:galactitol 2-dehydrogenase